MQGLCLLFRLSISEVSGVVNILAAKLLSYRGAFRFIVGELYSIGVGLTADHSATFVLIASFNLVLLFCFC